MKIRAGVSVFYAPDDELAIDEAKTYIQFHELTSEDVRMVRTGGGIVVVTKKEVQLKEESFIEYLQNRSKK